MCNVWFTELSSKRRIIFEEENMYPNSANLGKKGRENLTFWTVHSQWS